MNSNYNCTNYSYQSHHACILLKKVLNEQNVGILVQMSEKFPNFRNFNKPMHTRKSQEPNHFYELILVCEVTLYRLLYQCDRNACYHINHEPSLKVLHEYFFIISNKYPLLVIVVGTEACHKYVKEKHEIRYHINDSLPIFTFVFPLKSYEVRHQEGHIEEEQHDYERPDLLEPGVRMYVEVKLPCISICKVA